MHPGSRSLLFALATVGAVPGRAHAAPEPEAAATSEAVVASDPVADPEASTPEPPAAATPAAPADPLVAAQEAHNLGRRLYDEAKYEEALGSFLDAQRLYASPDHHFNIARCYEALGRYELAAEYYRAYLRSNPRDRANIESTVERIEGLIAGTPQPQPEPDPEPEPEPEPGMTNPERAPGPTPGRGLMIAGGVLAGAGAAIALGGGIGAGLAAQRRSDDVAAVFEDGNPDQLGLADTRALDSEGKRFETIQIATVVVGGVVAVTGAALLLVGHKKRKSSAGATPTAAVGRNFAGVALRGRF